ncbi:MAG: hypothetical protein KA004_04620 [Verrucomicrobiales bacterium]|nr:hypothetical protein [Verrucomicrobiales bacterium]
MPQLIEDTLTTKLAEWINTNRPVAIPETVPVHVANRDELRTRPCIVLETSEAKLVPALPFTARVKLDVHLFTQTDDTSASDHSAWSAALESLLRDKSTIRTAIETESFCLHDLLPRETSTTPDESRGRETILSFEAVVSAV